MIHVLIAHRKEEMREALAAAARTHPCTVEVAGGRAEALERMRARTPDLLFVGDAYPDGSVEDLLDEARRLGVTGSVRVENSRLDDVRRALGSAVAGVFFQLNGKPLPPGREGPGGSVRIPSGTPIREADRRLILTTLAHCDGRRAPTAEKLGITLEELYARLRDYGLTAVDPDDAPVPAAGCTTGG